MPIAADTLLNEARCLGCNSEASEAALLKLGLWQRLASLTDVDEIVDSFVERSGISDQTQIDAVSQLVLSARVHGWWDLCDLIYPFVGGTAGAHAQNLKSSSFPITWNGTVTHNANGITGDGATGYGDTGYVVPTSFMAASATFAHAGIYRRTYATGFLQRTAAGSFSSFGFLINHPFPGLNPNNVNGAAMGDGLVTTITNGALGFNVISRLNSSTHHRYYAGGIELVAAQASGSFTTPRSFYALALNNNGATSNFTDLNLAFLTVGSGITFAEYQQMASDIQVFQTSLGRQV